MPNTRIPVHNGRSPPYCRRVAIPRADVRSSAVPTLRSARIFAGLPDDVLARLADACAHRTYRRGQYLWHQGDEGGKFRRHRIRFDQGGARLRAGRRGCAAERSGAEKRSASWRSWTARRARRRSLPPSRPAWLTLSRETVLALLTRHPSVLDALLRSLGGLVRQLGEQAGDLVFLDLPGRVAKLLLHLAEAHGGGAQPPVVDLGLFAVGPRRDGRRHPSGGEPGAAG